MDFAAMRDLLGDIWIFGDPAPLLAFSLILLVNLTLTLVHTVEEFNGRLWRYFGAIAGIKVPDWLGFPLFSVALTLLLWALGLAGIARGVPPFAEVPENWAIAAIGGLIGCRIGDGIFSHVRLHRGGFQPNPGLRSTPYYFAEALILSVLFFPGLSHHPTSAAVGLLLGVLFFWVVLPILRFTRTILVGPLRALRQEPWEPWQPRPQWAR